MAPAIERVKDRIEELAGRQSNVRVNEIEWVVAQLKKLGYDTDTSTHAHGTFFTVNGRSFNVCTHHQGSSQVRTVYVRDFLEAMIALGLY